VISHRKSPKAWPRPVVSHLAPGTGSTRRKQHLPALASVEPCWSGKAVARSGLRMMPTFPPPPLKFRTVGFPQYGFKASLSAEACPSNGRVKLAPSIPQQPIGLLPPSRTPRRRDPRELRCLAPKGNPEGSSPRDAPLTPGVLGSGPSSAVSVHRCLLRPHPSVSQARGDFTGWPFIRPAFAVRERRGDPRDVPSFPCRAVPACR
jgi:hypothetical protein